MRDWKRAILAVSLLLLSSAATAQSVTPAFLVRGVAKSLSELFPFTNQRILPNGNEVVGWTAGFYWNMGNFSPSLQVMGDDPLICGGCLAHFGQPIWGYSFRSASLGVSQGSGDWDGGSVMVDTAFLGASATVDLLILQRCDRPVGATTYVCTNYYTGPMTFPTKGPVLLNPMARAIETGSYGEVNAQTIFDSPTAYALSADGQSAVVVALESSFQNEEVTFSVAPHGTVTAFKSDYLDKPVRGTQSTIKVPTEAWCDSTKCVYLALVWPPESMPASSGSPPRLDLSVQATQAGVLLGTSTIRLQPPPVLLVHGVWSNPSEARFLRGRGGLADWLAKSYGHDLVDAVDYGPGSHIAFDQIDTQMNFQVGMLRLLERAAKGKTAARKVDVIGHSMGGLVTRRYMIYGDAVKSFGPPDPIGKLVTIGTPHLGSPLAQRLWQDRNRIATVSGGAICAVLGLYPCTLANVFERRLNKKITTGAVQSLIPNGPNLSALSSGGDHYSIGAVAPAGSVSEYELNVIIGGFLPGETVSSIMPGLHDTIVPVASQRGNRDLAWFGGYSAVHTALFGDIWSDGETADSDIWRAAYQLLTGLSPPPADKSRAMMVPSLVPPFPFDLTGYTEVPGSNIGFDPPSGSSFAANSVVSIGAYSTTKTLTQLWLFQTVEDPTDVPTLAAIGAPFVVTFAPQRLGTAEFVGVALFSDMTYAVAALSYPLIASGPPISLALTNAPQASVVSGMTLRTPVFATYASGPVDVSPLATYKARSGAASVFSVEPNGEIVTTGVGADWLDVSFAGLTVSTKVTVGIPGSCSNFADTDASSGFCKNIEWLRNRSITLGCGSSQFCPDAQVSRAQMAAFMNRFGGVFTPEVVTKEESPGSVVVGVGNVVCQTQDVTINDFPRAAWVKGVFMARASSSVQFDAVPVASFDGGGAWVALTSATPASTAGLRWSNATAHGKIDLNVGQQVRFGLHLTRASLGGGTPSLIDSRCNVRARIGNRNGVQTPF